MRAGKTVVSKEIGPRERALREMREATREQADRDMASTVKKLRGAVAVAAEKRGKVRKKKVK